MTRAGGVLEDRAAEVSLNILLLLLQAGSTPEQHKRGGGGGSSDSAANAKEVIGDVGDVY